MVNTARYPKVASLVKRIRKKHGLTQEALARELNVSFATVNGWERGRRKPIPALMEKLLEKEKETTT